MKAKPVWIAIATCLLTLGAVWLALNLASGEKKIERQVERLYATEDPQFRRAMGALLGPPIVEGNKVDVLLNGDAIFAAMLKAIGQARHSITFETYIYWSDTIGREFADALIARARDDVRVHVLLDWVGSVKMEQRYLDEMKRAGVEVERYHKPNWAGLFRMNNRTHRKVLVVDGQIGFTGGVGIADKWRGDAQDAEHWRDTHFRVEGPVVAQMQSVFMDNWIKATGRVLHGERYFPALTSRGEESAQMFSSSPTGGSESMHLMYLMALTAATHSIHLSNSYFVPDELAVKALVAAARRGVKVQIITPGGEIDSEVVRGASRARWGPLLEAGVLIAEYQPTMFHCKVLVVDGLLVSAGSTNFDNRSFRLNDEANLNVLNAPFARQQIEVFQRDLQRSKPITLQAWQQRPWQEKVLEHTSSWFGSQL
ncbi:MAG TPA: cardiolipin synthase [Burkholderiaceae bacterium]|nr:cardiolipin synthase [Burkholderiaceae bacterium]